MMNNLKKGITWIQVRNRGNANSKASESVYQSSYQPS